MDERIQSQARKHDLSGVTSCSASSGRTSTRWFTLPPLESHPLTYW